MVPFLATLFFTTRQLHSDSRELEVESVERAKGGHVSQGPKGDPMMLGVIALQVLPDLLPSVFSLVRAWMTRGQGRAVIFKGMGIELEGSAGDLHNLLERLEKGVKNI